MRLTMASMSTWSRMAPMSTRWTMASMSMRGRAARRCRPGPRSRRCRARTTPLTIWWTPLGHGRPARGARGPALRSTVRHGRSRVVVGSRRRSQHGATVTRRLGPASTTPSTRWRGRTPASSRLHSTTTRRGRGRHDDELREARPGAGVLDEAAAQAQPAASRAPPRRWGGPGVSTPPAAPAPTAKVVRLSRPAEQVVDAGPDRAVADLLPVGGVRA